jgi:hypothetical protein
MIERATILERAFQLAESGECDSLTAIKDRLKQEGYADAKAYITGPTLLRQLRALCAASRAWVSCDRRIPKERLGAGFGLQSPSHRSASMPHDLAILPIATALALAAQGAQLPAPAVPAGLSARFVCPEALPDDAARQRALQDFYAAYARAKPTATGSEASLYRLVLLKTHDCKRTPLPPPRVSVLTGADARFPF